MSKKENKKNYNDQINNILSYLALGLLAGLAYQGIISLVESKPSIQTTIGIIVVVLLVKTALKK